MCYGKQMFLISPANIQKSLIKLPKVIAKAIFYSIKWIPLRYVI